MSADGRMSVDDLIALTITGALIWSRDPDPVASWNGDTILAACRQVYHRHRGRWVTLGPSADLRRAIDDVRARENAR